MASVRFSSVKRLQISIRRSLNLERHTHSTPMNFTTIARLPSDSLSCVYPKVESKPSPNFARDRFTNLACESLVSNTKFNESFNTKFSSLGFRSTVPFASSMLNCRTYSSSVGGKGNGDGGTEVNAGGTNGAGDSVIDGDWAEKITDSWKSVVETADELTPYDQQLLDSHPYLNELVSPVGGAITATLIAWTVMPMILRKFHKYAVQSSVSEPVPYENSFWGALEDPLFKFIAWTQIVVIAAHVAPAWRDVVILSYVWFLHRLKMDVFMLYFDRRSLSGRDIVKSLFLLQISDLGLFVIMLCNLSVRSILIVGGVLGVASAFAAKDILGNVFSGFSMQFSKPFSIGDTIKAGSVEGQVMEMGLITTSLLSAEKFPVIVPNSFFSSQVIVNKSRAEYRAIVNKIPLQIEDLSKIPQILDDVKSMLRSNAMVFLRKDAPYCFLSRIESSFAELTLGYNLKHMRKDELYSAEQDVLLQTVQIIKNHGVALGSTLQDISTK